MALKLGLKGFSWCIDKYGDTILEKVPGNYYTPKKQKHKGSVAGNQEQQRIDQDQDPQEEQQQDPQPPQQQQQQQQQLLQQSPTQRPQYKRAVFSSYHTGRRRSFSDFDPGHQDHDHFDDRLSDLEAGTMSYDQPQRDVYGRRYTPADYTPAADRDYGDAQQRGGYDRDGYAQQVSRFSTPRGPERLARGSWNRTTRTTFSRMLARYPAISPSVSSKPGAEHAPKRYFILLIHTTSHLNTRPARSCPLYTTLRAQRNSTNTHPRPAPTPNNSPAPAPPPPPTTTTAPLPATTKTHPAHSTVATAKKVATAATVVVPHPATPTPTATSSAAQKACGATI